MADITREAAAALVGRHSRKVMRNAAIALAFDYATNTDEEWRLLEACLLLLGDEAPEYAIKVLKHYKEG